MIHEFRLTLDRTTAAGPIAPGIAEATGVSFGRASDQSATVAILGEPGHERQAAALADAYLQGGRVPTACAACQVGAVVVDHTTGVATIVAAPIGLRQIYWSAEAGTCSVASDPRGLSNPLGRALAIRPEALFNYLYFHMLPGPETFFAGIEKLDGGHTLRWNGRDAVLSRYWRPRFDDVTAIPEADAAQELFRLLRSAVGRSLQDHASAGAFLSGGLDSSTVAGLASEQRPGIPTISMGFDAAGYDEMEFARIASRHFKTTPLEYYVTPDDVLSTLPEIAAAFPEPFGNSSAAAAYHCARIAREHGIDLLLAGDGGDELFGGNERYAKQLVFERYSRVPRPVRSTLLEPLVNAAGRVTRAFPIGKAVSYIEQANVPLPDRLQTYNFLHRHDPSEVFAPELLEQMDASRPLQPPARRIRCTGHARCRESHAVPRLEIHAPRQRPREGQCHVPARRRRGRLSDARPVRSRLQPAPARELEGPQRATPLVLQACDAGFSAQADCDQDQARLRAAIRRLDPHTRGAAAIVRGRPRVTR